MTASIQSVALGRLALSNTGAQGERRKRFDKGAIAELAESIKTVGLLQPLVVRAMFRKDGGEDGFQIVAGERRFLAAKVAGLQEVQVNVRHLTDQQVLEVQLIENLQREGLHELVEAEGYEALMKQHAFTVEDLVAKVGKSRGYVYARLKLTALGPAARQMFFDGKFNASIALLLARIPDPALQRKACGEIMANRYGDGAMSFRAAADHVQRNYMLKLAEAGFPTGDANLVPAAGACGTCPKRTGNQAELFSDVRGADVCTDPPCFRAKREAHTAKRLQEARAQGRKIIEGKQAQAIAPHGLHSIQGGYVRLDDHCHSDGKNRTYRQILGKTAESTLLTVVDRKGDAPQIVEIIDKSVVATALKDRGVAPESGNDRYRSQERSQEKKRLLELNYRAELMRQIQAAGFKDDAAADLRLACEATADRLHHDRKVRLFKVMGWSVTERKDKYRGAFKEYDIDKVVQAAKSESDLWRLLRVLSVAGDLEFYSNSKPERSDRLHKLAERVGVKANKVRAMLEAEAKAKGKKPASAKKK